MSREKKKQIKTVLTLNLIIGIYNIYNYTVHGYLSALVIGVINIGVWALLRDMKLIPVVIPIARKILNKR